MYLRSEILAIIAFLFTSNVMMAQIGFNKRYLFGEQGKAIAYAVAESEGHIYCSGVGAIPGGISADGVFSARLDNHGHVLNSIYYELDFPSSLSTAQHNDAFIIDGKYHSLYKQYEIENLFSSDFENDSLEIEWSANQVLGPDFNIQTKRIEMLSSDSIITAAIVGSELDVWDYRVGVFQYLNEELSHFDYSLPNDRMAVTDFQISEKNTIVMTGYLIPKYVSTFSSDNYYQIFVIEMNMKGMIFREYFTSKDLNLFQPSDAVLTKDGSIIILAKEKNFNAGDMERPVILKVNKEGEIEWLSHVNYHRYFTHGFAAEYSRILPAIDGDGYVFAGQLNFPTPEDALIVKGVIGKINEAGELMWRKEYTIDDEPYLSHEINDMEYTSDQGYICAGKVTIDINISSDTFPFNAWLLKVDAEGNINTDPTYVNDAEYKTSILVYPNPTSSILNIKLPKNLLKEGIEFYIHGIDGQLLMRESLNQDFTGIVKFDFELPDLGIYSIVKNREVIKSGKIVFRH